MHPDLRYERDDQDKLDNYFDKLLDEQSDKLSDDLLDELFETNLDKHLNEQSYDRWTFNP